MHTTIYHKIILDVDCQEILLQVDTLHMWIGGMVVELRCQIRLTAGNLTVPVGLQEVFSELTERQQLSK